MKKKNFKNKKYFNVKSKSKNRKQAITGDTTWQNVKIAGKLVTDDGGGLEGLIGLEVMEDYDRAYVKKGMAIKSTIPLKKRQAYGGDSSDDGSDNEHKRKKKPKKKPQLKEKFVKDKSVKKQQKDDSGIEDDSEVNANESTVPQPGQFVLLKNNKKSTPEDKKEQQKPKKGKSGKRKPEKQPAEDAELLPKLTIDDLEGWNGMGVPEQVLQALAEKGFKSPTEIQTLTLPAAIMGRRDILGAAETGSGKTLAFGIPILAGILHLKEMEERKRNETESEDEAEEEQLKEGDESEVEEELEEEDEIEQLPKSKKKHQKFKKHNERDNLTPPLEEIDNFPDDLSLDEDSDESELEDNFEGDATDESDVEDEPEVEEEPEEEDEVMEAPIEKKKTKKKPQKFRKREERDNLTPPPEEIDNFPDDLPLDAKDMKAFGIKKSSKNNLNSPLYALVLTPTRELCVQVRDHLVAAAKFANIKVAAIFGGLAAVKQERVLRKCPEIVVATPGRLWELLQEGNAHLNKVDSINYLVIDETDRMVEKGHFEELQLLLERLNRDEAVKKKRQNFVFSATLTMVHDLPEHLRAKNSGRKRKLQKMTSEQKINTLIEHLGISQPKIVDITQSQGTAQNLAECRLICEFEQKDYYLYYFLMRHPGRTIVFCNSIESVKRLSQLLGLLNAQPLPLHANMIQKQRLKNLERFTNNPLGLLIATDVAARGLDIPNVQHVIHYQVPRTSENYVHRSGRTARANQEGIAVLLMEPSEIRNYVKLCRTLNRSEDLPLFPVSERHYKMVMARVNLARDVDKLDLKTRRSEGHTGWLKKAAREMDMVIDGQSSDDSDNEASQTAELNREKKVLKAKRNELATVLSKPLFPEGFSFKYPTSSGKLEMPIGGEGSVEARAFDVLKDAVEMRKLEKKNRNKKRKMDYNAEENV